MMCFTAHFNFLNAELEMLSLALLDMGMQLNFLTLRVCVSDIAQQTVSDLIKRLTDP